MTHLHRALEGNGDAGMMVGVISPWTVVATLVGTTAGLSGVVAGLCVSSSKVLSVSVVAAATVVMFSRAADEALRS